MKQEDKELLLMDLCSRLPYGVKFIDVLNLTERPLTLQSIGDDGLLMATDGFSFDLEHIKPYMLPMSSMTKEQSEIYNELIRGMFGTSVLINLETLIDWLHTNHFDYRGLIEKGLAIDATGLNIY